MKITSLIIALIFYSSCYTQTVQLHYAGKNATIISAVNEANFILSNEAFYHSIDSINSFDNTTLNGRQISAEMKQSRVVEVTEYYKKHTRTNAKTQTKLKLNTAKLNRSLASITSTLIHETIHAVDWAVNGEWDYTHRTQYVENPPISAPYVIGELAERFVRMVR